MQVAVAFCFFLFTPPKYTTVCVQGFLFFLLKKSRLKMCFDILFFQKMCHNPVRNRRLFSPLLTSSLSQHCFCVPMWVNFVTIGFETHLFEYTFSFIVIIIVLKMFCLAYRHIRFKRAGSVHSDRYLSWTLKSTQKCSKHCTANIFCGYNWI